MLRPLLASFSSLIDLQGVLRALEEYGIPIDHIGGKIKVESEFLAITNQVKARASAPLLADCMLKKAMFYRALDVRSSSARDWGTFGDCSQMSLIH